MNWVGRLAQVLLLVGGPIVAQACRSLPDEALRLSRFEFERLQMGTLFRVVLYAPDQLVANAASAAAFARLDELNARLSDYDPESELSKLSRCSDLEVPTPWIAISTDLSAVLVCASAISNASDGAFDVTCGNATRLWRRAIREAELPTQESLDLALPTIDWRAVELSGDHTRARLTRHGMRLDLGGIAKGYAVDQMLSALAQRGVHSALVVGGGDVGVNDAPPGESGWRIELSPVTQAQTGPRSTLLLAHAAVSTSGDLYRSRLIGGRCYSHIVDPYTGIGLTTQCGASVIASDSMTADALATAATVLGTDASERLWSRFEGCEFRVAAKTDHELVIRESPRFARQLAP